jgi:hypothetical protein
MLENVLDPSGLGGSIDIDTESEKNYLRQLSEGLASTQPSSSAGMR